MSRVLSGRWKRDWHLTWGRRTWTGRTWLVLLLMLGLAVGYSLSWSTFVRLNTELIYHQQPSGAAVEWDGVTFRVTEIHRQARLDEGYDGDGLPTEGSSWVTAVLEVSGPNTAQVLGRCRLDLLGPDGRTWEQVWSADDLPRSCDEETGPGPALIHLTFEVPDQYVDQLYGLVVPSNSVHRQVIRP